MPEFEMDAMFERRLAQRLGDFGSEAVRPFDAVQIAATAAALSGGPGVGARLGALMPRGWRLVVATALLALGLLGAGVLGGLIKLPTNLTPDPTFQPFSPLPVATTPLETPDVSASPIGSGASPSLVVTGPPLGSPTAEPSPSEAPTPSPIATPTPSPTPSPDPATLPVNSVVAVTTGDTHACALADDGRVFCWGENDQGQLGDGTTDYRQLGTVPVAGITNASAIAAGIRFSCAALEDGSVWCWGEDPGSDATSTVPVKVPGIDDAQFLTAGGAFVCALRETHQVVCWGNNALGQLGTGTFGGPDQATPQPVDGLSDAVEIAAGWNHACAIRFDRRVWCWGGNGDGATGYGQLGDGTLQNRASPVEVVGLGDVIGIAAGGWTTCATPVDDSVWCWGYGERGTLGDGNFSNSSLPIQVAGLDNVGLLAVGDFTACASRVDDSVWCWGDTSWVGAEAGIPVEGKKTSPLTVAALANDEWCYLIDGTGQAWFWGSGANATPNLWPVGP